MTCSNPRNRIFSAIAAILFIATLLAGEAAADGGQVIAQQTSGPYLVTVFAAPVPPRAGVLDVTVLIQLIESGEPVLDAKVGIALSQAGAEPVRGEAIRGRGQNQLLYGALLLVPRAGEWSLAVEIEHDQAGSAKLESTLPVAPARPWILAYWRSFLLPPLAVALFLLNQYLKRRMRGARK